MRVVVLGCGDAFGSGGRLNTAFFLDGEPGVLIDCGASTLPAMKRLGISADQVDVVVLSHLHGDHYGGLPFIIRETQVAVRRTKPLTVIGPEGHERVIRATMELMFPGSPAREPSFALTFATYASGTVTDLAGIRVSAMPVRHTPGTSAHAVKVLVSGREIAYSGDTEWMDDLISFSADADLFICECYQLTRVVPNHIDYETLSARRAALTCKKLVLTHMGDDVLRADDAAMPERLVDGMRIIV